MRSSRPEVTGTLDSDQDSGPGDGERWSGSECVLEEQQQQDQIRAGCKRERERGIKGESRVFGKMDLLSAEMGKTGREQVEVSGSQFSTGCF